MLEIKGDVQFCIRNLQKGNELTITMQSGELVINNEVVTPFVLQKLVRGSMDGMQNQLPTHIIVMHFDRMNKTAFTKAGYVSLLLSCSRNTGIFQIHAYIKREYLREFFGIICEASV